MPFTLWHLECDSEKKIFNTKLQFDKARMFNYDVQKSLKFVKPKKKILQLV